MSHLSEIEVERIQRRFGANQVDDQIWLGDISSAQDVEALNLFKIKHILSIMNFVPVVSNDDQRIRKHIDAYDTPSTNLIQNFHECFEFIDNAIVEGSNILVHCLAGVSRSATIVCAYLMRKYNWSDDEAINKLQEKRRLINPNVGFRKQLRLFYKNQWKVPPPEVKCDQPMTTIQSERDSTSIEYKCKICRQTLFGEFDVVKHLVGKGRFDAQSRSSSYKAKQNSDFQNRPNCEAELFTDQPVWLTDIFGKPVNDGDIICPNQKCQAKVGRYSLIGEKCSCAAWVNPAFHFHQTKVDRYAPLNSLNEMLARKQL